MPEIVFSSSINMNDVINLASLYKDKIKQHKIEEEVSKNISNTSGGGGGCQIQRIYQRNLPFIRLPLSFGRNSKMYRG